MEKLHTSIPPQTTHNLSWNLPHWDDVTRAQNENTLGYPRYQLHSMIQRLTDILKDKYAKDNEKCLVFPSYTVAKRVREYIKFHNSIARSSTTTRLKVRILQLSTSEPLNDEERIWKRVCKVAVVFINEEYYHLMWEYWQLTGEIISSRVAEYVLHELFIIEKSTKTRDNNNSGSHTDDVNESNSKPGQGNTIEYIETRFGRSLNFMLADKAKRLIKKRIATKVVDLENDTLNDRDENDYMLNMDLMNLHNFNDDSDEDSEFEDEYNRSHNPTNNSDNHNNNNNILQSLIPAEPMNPGFNDIPESDSNSSLASSVATQQQQQQLHHHQLINFNRDIYLFPSGMAAIHLAHRTLLYLDNERINRLRIPSNQQSPSKKKTVILGTCIPDTYKLISKFNDFHFIKSSGQQGLEDLKDILHSGEQILAVFIEAPNVMNKFEMINLIDLKKLSELFGFNIIIDESNGGFINIDGLIYCDIMVSSLGKLFSNYDITNNEEDHDVMAGSLIVNPQGKMYNEIQTFIKEDYEDLLWCEDAIHLEQNSRDVINKNNRINKTTLTLMQDVFIPNKSQFKEIYHPSLPHSGQETYDLVKCKKHGGYGGIILLTFHSLEEAKQFYNNVKLYKSIGLGTNLTLLWPYYLGMDTKEYELKYGCEFDKTMIRICIGLEDPKVLSDTFLNALKKYSI